MASLGEILKSFYVKIGLDADTAKFAAAISAAEGLQAALTGLVKASISLTEKAVDMVDSVAKYGREVFLTAERTGLTTDAVQDLTYAGQNAGISMEAMASKIGRLQRSMLEARQGSKKMNEAFSALGINFEKDGKLRDAEDVLLDLADAVKKIPKGDTERLAQTLELLGGHGVGSNIFVAFLRQGRDGISSLAAEQRAYGNFLDHDAIEATNQYAFATRRMNSALAGVKTQVAIAVLPALTEVKDRIVAFVVKYKKPLIEFLTSVVSFAVRVTRVVSTVIQRVTLYFSEIVAWLAKLGPAVRTFAFIWLGFWAIATAPITFLIGALAALFLIIDDFIAFFKGDDSVIGEIVQKWTTFANGIYTPKPGAPWIVVLLTKVLNLIETIRQNWAEFEQAMGEFFGTRAIKAATPEEYDDLVKAQKYFKRTTGMNPFPAGIQAPPAYTQSVPLTEDRASHYGLNIDQVHIHAETNDPKVFAQKFMEAIGIEAQKLQEHGKH